MEIIKTKKRISVQSNLTQICLKVKNVDSCDNAALHLGGLMGEQTVTYHVECLSADSDQVSQDWRTPEEWTAGHMLSDKSDQVIEIGLVCFLSSL